MARLLGRKVRVVRTKGLELSQERRWSALRIALVHQVPMKLGRSCSHLCPSWV